eukprot:CAMPEP_0177403540 /NCGR_PEP_ID=MMETSP0368-20130122/60905_1 /TAXON_ID=447022 ORGANISM="Scrippsiella hangoei-like, Strain SHHI-4" /NCGR_SAMPLE_ID=MMETSP0368 /ASSEMBLY_ACC=CAM_ASM_000363 /LENGTH=201 /DNA_ID=CAMNT_0018871529 /DNA_START=495 /DNA_END=1102 /DNA_ORIENTATION=-
MASWPQLEPSRDPNNEPLNLLRLAAERGLQQDLIAWHLQVAQRGLYNRPHVLLALGIVPSTASERPADGLESPRPAAAAFAACGLWRRPTPRRPRRLRRAVWRLTDDELAPVEPLGDDGGVLGVEAGFATSKRRNRASKMPGSSRKVPTSKHASSAPLSPIRVHVTPLRASKPPSPETVIKNKICSTFFPMPAMFNVKVCE